MPTRVVELHEGAAAEYDAAFDWYLQRSPDAALKLDAVFLASSPPSNISMSGLSGTFCAFRKVSRDLRNLIGGWCGTRQEKKKSGSPHSCGLYFLSCSAIPESVTEHPMNPALTAPPETKGNAEQLADERASGAMKPGLDVYFSADVETDGPIPGPFSILSFALVFAGTFDGQRFTAPQDYRQSFYRELRPISDDFQPEALRVNGLDRNRLIMEGERPEAAMTEAAQWIRGIIGQGKPILVAYPLSFDWSWLYWYFTKFSAQGSPFNHSLCFDIKTAFAVKAGVPISEAGKSKLLPSLRPQNRHTHHALDDAIEQAEIFARVFGWEGNRGRSPRAQT